MIKQENKRFIRLCGRSRQRKYFNNATRYGLGGIPVGIAKLGDEAGVIEGVGTNKEKEELLLCIPLGQKLLNRDKNS